ncbi:MAG: glycosyltransferase [Myxococcales bacterium]|nr:glycosyltransferase [Myxococcales bacterium]
MNVLVLVLYFCVLGVLAGIGLHRLLATVASCGYRVPKLESLHHVPRVLIQLPLYNEAFVAERVIRAVALLRYPTQNLLIQILDDSTDHTRTIVDRVASQLRAQGVPIEIVRRSSRVGFKAGALAQGLTECGEVDAVAIFDADFVPSPDFLEKMVPRLFAFPDIGLIQARWGHLNRDESLLTRAQGVFLDGHFAVEHAARVVCQHPFNFNGTAGVWRLAAIEDAGGWESDTVTEDLDLSYRSQLAGWRFIYAHDVVVPAELPNSWSAFRAQQARWVRGSVETTRKLLWQVMRSQRLTLSARLDATIHLTNNFAYLFMGCLACLLPITLVIREELGWRVPGGRNLLSWLDIFMLSVGTLAMVVFYAWALHRTRVGVFRRIGDVGYALCLGAGMSLSNASAVIKGLVSRESVFVRTPKKGNIGQEGTGGYRARSMNGLMAAEVIFAAYYTAASMYAVYWEVWGALPFLGFYLIGFLSVGMGSVTEAWSADRTTEIIASRATSVPSSAKRS